MKLSTLIAALLAATLALPATAQSDDNARREAKRAEKRAQRGEAGTEERRGPGGEFRLPAQPPEVARLAALSVVLGRPTESSVTANVLSSSAKEAYIEYGPRPGQYSRKTAVVTLAANVPVELLLDSLAPDATGYYRLRHRVPGAADYAAEPEQSVHTQRRPGSAFTFEVQGDSHPERRQQFDPALYAQTLSHVAADKPDFYLTMGDDFSVDTLHEINKATVSQRYETQRPFLALVGQSAPLFLVNGNHEQAAAANLDGTPDNVAVWAQNARNRYFPQPAPDRFYTGNGTPVEHIGLLRNYFAWTWGDALFVVIDPYWHTEGVVDNPFGDGKPKAKRPDRWTITLGDAQYRWLAQTLSASKAKFKFVFAHHVLGTGRGGIEQATLYEWGGKSQSGVDEFRSRRPTWELPVHQLMAKNGVTIFFQGHDHVFARQELDGVIYQTLPEPADPNYAWYFRDIYRMAEIHPNSGRVRVSVAPEKVSVEYVRSWLPGDVPAGQTDNSVAHAYKVMVRPGGKP